MRERFSNISVEQSRAMAKHVGFPLPKGTTVTQVSEISAQWVNVNNSPRSKVLLYLHGGGYIQNTPKIHHTLVSRLVVCAVCVQGVMKRTSQGSGSNEGAG